MGTNVYDDSFFDYADRSSIGSAREIVPILQAMLPNTTSVVDFGCARGAWLHVWQENGIKLIQGLDGDYVEKEKLLIPEACFRAGDISKALDLKQQYDLVQSLEVAEHLPHQNAEEFVGNLTRHGKVVLFSAAPPGQGGAHHINEQPFDYWRRIFEKKATGYLIVFDLKLPIARIFKFGTDITVFFLSMKIGFRICPSISCNAKSKVARRFPL